jgi:hypothetical protein
MGKLTSDRRIMGKYVSSTRWKAAYWLSLASVLTFGVVALVSAL